MFLVLNVLQLVFNQKCLQDLRFLKGSRDSKYTARVNQQPPMHQLAVLSTGWAVFFHSASDGVYHDPFLFAADHCIFLFRVCFWLLFSLDLTSHIATLLTFLPS